MLEGSSFGVRSNLSVSFSAESRVHLKQVLRSFPSPLSEHFVSLKQLPFFVLFYLSKENKNKMLSAGRQECKGAVLQPHYRPRDLGL